MHEQIASNLGGVWHSRVCTNLPYTSRKLPVVQTHRRKEAKPDLAH